MKREAARRPVMGVLNMEKEKVWQAVETQRPRSYGRPYLDITTNEKSMGDQMRTPTSG